MKFLQSVVSRRCRHEILFLLFWLVRPLSSQPLAKQMQPLDGTFLQLLQDHGNWSAEQWNTLFSDLESIGVHKLILQWSVADNLSFFPSTTFATVQGAPLERVLELADKSQMQVLIGLIHDSTYWSQIKKNPAEIKLYLASIRLKSLTAASELVPILNRHSSVRGWYIPEEIDDISWRNAEARAVLLEQLGGLAAELKRMTRQWTVSISAFSQGQVSPVGFQQFWDEFLQHVPLDSVLYQDGIGAGKVDFNGLPIYLEAIRSAVDKNHRRLGVVVELFQETSGPSIGESKFQAVPASMERVSCQLEIDGKYTSDGLIAFSVPEYMRPAAGEAAGKLLTDYRRFIAEHSTACNQK